MDDDDDFNIFRYINPVTVYIALFLINVIYLLCS